MKVKLIKTYTGAWLEVGDFKVSDFDMEQTDPRYVNDRKAVNADIILTLHDSVKKKLIGVLGDPGVYKTPLEDALFGTEIWLEREETFKAIFIRVNNEAKLKNVRTAITKSTREQEAMDKIQERLEKYSTKWIAERIEGLNVQVRLNVERANESTLHHAKSTLSWFDPWVKEADDKAGTEKLKDEISDLKKQVKAKQNMLKEKRNRAFYAAFEKEGWVGPDPENAPLPKEVVKLWKGMLTKCEAFKGDGRLIF